MIRNLEKILNEHLPPAVDWRTINELKTALLAEFPELGFECRTEWHYHGNKTAEPNVVTRRDKHTLDLGTCRYCGADITRTEHSGQMNY